MAMSHTDRSCRLLVGQEQMIQDHMLAYPDLYPKGKGRGERRADAGEAEPKGTLRLAEDPGLGGCAGVPMPGQNVLPGAPPPPRPDATISMSNEAVDSRAKAMGSAGKAHGFHAPSAAPMAMAPQTPMMPAGPTIAPHLASAAARPPMPMAGPPMPMAGHPLQGAIVGDPMQNFMMQSQQFQVGMMHQMQEMQRQMHEMRLQGQQGSGSSSSQSPYGKKGEDAKGGGKGHGPY